MVFIRLLGNGWSDLDYFSSRKEINFIEQNYLPWACTLDKIGRTGTEK